MSYTKITDFAAKDALTTGNPAKLAKGTEVDAEFNAIAVADALNVKTTSLGTGVATFLSTPTSSNLAAAITNETGTVFSISPTLVTPALGTPTALVGTNITGTASGLSIGGNATSATSATSATYTTGKTTVASAATPDIFAASVKGVINYTGATQCSGFVAAPEAGARRTLIIEMACNFVSSANLIIAGLPSGTNLPLAADAIVEVIAITTTQFYMTYRMSGTFTATGTGFTTSPTATWRYIVSNGIVNLFVSMINGTSNSTSMTATGIPTVAQILPGGNAQGYYGYLGSDNGTNLFDMRVGLAAGSGTMTLIPIALGLWTNSGTKAMFGGTYVGTCCITYFAF